MESIVHKGSDLDLVCFVYLGLRRNVEDSGPTMMDPIESLLQLEPIPKL